MTGPRPRVIERMQACFQAYPCTAGATSEIPCIKESWFPVHMVNGDSEGRKLVKPGPTMEHNSRKSLKRKGFINFNTVWVWLT